MAADKDQDALNRGILRRIDPNYMEVAVDQDLIVALNKAGLRPELLPSFYREGGRIVSFRYTISIIVLTFFRSTGYVIIKPGESAFKKALPHCALSICLGCWGLPWGPIWTLRALITNLSGGQDHMPAILSLPDAQELLEMEERRLTRHRNLAIFIPFMLFVLLFVYIGVTAK